MSENAPGSSRRVVVAFDRASVRRTLILVVLLVIGYRVGAWVFESVSAFLLELLVAWLVAVSIDPLVVALSRRGWRRGLAAGLVIGVLCVAAIAFIVLLGRATLDQLNAAATSLPEAAESASTWVNGTFGLTLDTSSLFFDEESGDVTAVAAGTAGGVLNALTQLLNGVVALAIVAVLAFYLSADGPRLQRFIASFLRPDRQVVFMRVWDIGVAKAGAFVVSKSLLASLSAVAHTGFFWLIDVPYWLPLGLFAGVVSQFIPAIGTYVGVVIPSAFALTRDPWDVVWIVAFAVVYQQIENYVLTPRLTKATMDMHPAVAISSVLVGAALLGPTGALIGIPLVAIAVAIAQAYVNRYDLHPDVHAATNAVTARATETDEPPRPATPSPDTSP